MTTTVVTVILLSFLSCITTCAGVALAVRFQNNVKGIAIGVGFSAGIMLLISFLELIPESLAVAGTYPTLAAVGSGIVLIWALHFVIPHTHLIAEKGKIKAAAIRSAYLVALGLILHDIPEGFAMAVALSDQISLNRGAAFPSVPGCKIRSAISTVRPR